MALVKTSKIAGRAAQAPKPAETIQRSAAPPVQASTQLTSTAQDKVSERLAAATEELAAGLTKASSAAEELRRSMEQIAAGAEEAAGSSQAQLVGIKQISTNLATARREAEVSRSRTEAVQAAMGVTAVRILASVRAIERNADRQTQSIQITSELERRANDVAEVARTVSGISDQTALLALNAAIEAARAGDHGRGFAVVADEVGALAATSDASAVEVQALTETIQADVREIAAAVKTAADLAIAEAAASAAVVETLDGLGREMTRISDGAQAILDTAVEAERSAIEAQRGAEQVAGAAAEQSAAASEAESGIQQQAQSLDQGSAAAKALARLSESLQAGATGDAITTQIGAAAEELSATIQELSSAASQIMAALTQIDRGSQEQASATQETSAALAQIERTAAVASDNATIASEQVAKLGTAIAGGRAAVERLVAGVGTVVADTRASLGRVIDLESIGRRIDRIVDTITLTVLQTSMLAVSGSIEAARAGDSGRGFAVVSGDIRKLARDASKNVSDIKETARGILDQMGALRRDLEQIVAVADSEIEANRGFATSFDGLAADVHLLGDASVAIRQSAEAIRTAVGEAAAAARQIAAAAEENSAASREAATASRQQASDAEELAASIEEIASLADELRRQDG